MFINVNVRVKFGEAYSLVAIVVQLGSVVNTTINTSINILEKLREYGDISLCKKKPTYWKEQSHC